MAAHAAKFYGLDYDPEDEVLITSGGTEAVTGALMAMAGVGDEVVMIEPTYDSYRPMAEAAGAVVKAIKLKPPRLAAGRSRSARGDRTQDPRHPDQLAAQSGGARFSAAKSWRCWRGWCRKPTRW